MKTYTDRKSPYDPKLPHGYPVDEFEATIWRAFKDGHDFIELDGHSGKYLVNCAAWGQKQGLLTPIEEICAPSDQWTVWRIRLTPKGRQHFELGAKYGGINANAT